MANKSDKILQKLGVVPQKPGVYLMKDNRGQVIYVGKAAKLANRVGSYFQLSARHSPRTSAMVELIVDFDIVITDTELEALVLECVLIKKYRPKYNVLLKDDKGYPYLRLTLSEEYPRLLIARRIGRLDKDLYFGPYAHGGSLRQTLYFIHDLFPLRHCVKMNPRQGRPCLNFQLHRCAAPCCKMVSREEYMELVTGVKLFLEGKNQDLVRLLKLRMDQAAADLRYEQAARIRDQISSINDVLERQKIVCAGSERDGDFLAMSRRGSLACFQIFFVRHGMLIGHKHLILEQVGDQTDQDLIADFIGQFYADKQLIPAHIYLPDTPAGQDVLESWLAQKRQGRVEMNIPQRGEKYNLIEMARQNAEQYLQTHLTLFGQADNLAQQVKDVLGLPEAPRRIEAFDISNIQGAQAVGSMVVWEDNGLRKSEYRRFRINTVDRVDDYAMLAEILRRRYSREARPGLILVDGGQGQLNTGLQVLQELNLAIPMVGLAKQEEEIYLPGAPEPLKLPRDSEVLRLLQRLRDEAHRFAVTYHRKLRKANIRHSALSEIPGVGRLRQQALLSHFGSLQGVREASLEDLCRLDFLNHKVANDIYRFLHH